MFIRIDTEAKAAYIILSAAKIARTVDLGEGFYADYTEDGALVGIESLNVDVNEHGAVTLEVPARIQGLLAPELGREN